MGFFKKIEKKISNAIPHQHSADKRADMYAAREQMQYYQQQKDSMNAASEKLNLQKQTESEKLHKQQIRGLRSHYKSRSGMMGAPSTDSPNSTLG
jgi:hypothetical protein